MGADVHGLVGLAFPKVGPLVAARGGVQPAPVGTVAAGSGAVGRGVLQVALLFGTSKSAAGRVVDHLAPLLVLPPHSTHPPAHAATTTTTEPAALTTTPAYNETTARSHCAENLAA